jgi:cytochrome P450
MSEAPASMGWNPFEPGYAEDPYPQYEVLRAHNPVCETPLGFWVLSRYDDVLAVLRDPATSVEDTNATPTVMAAAMRDAMGELADRGARAMLNVDPPDHTRLRRLVSKAFTPRVIEALRPRVQDLVNDRLDGVAGETVDLIAELAFPLPFAVISEMLGIAKADGDQLRTWSHLLVKTLDPIFDPNELPAIADAGERMREFVTEVIAVKRKHPAPDLMSALISAEEQGDVLTDEELLDQVILLYIAGHETTVNLIGNGVLALLGNRDQLDRLRDNPTLDANAVDELLRFDSPVQMSRRISLKELDLGGHVIPTGAFIGTSLASANRDERRWGPTAGQLDLGRADAAQHVAFGGGAHYCLGAALARVEGQVAIGTTVRRFPGIELADTPVWNGRINLRGLDRLPVRLAA